MQSSEAIRIEEDETVVDIGADDVIDLIWVCDEASCQLGVRNVGGKHIHLCAPSGEPFVTPLLSNECARACAVHAAKEHAVYAEEDLKALHEGIDLVTLPRQHEEDFGRHIQFIQEVRRRASPIKIL